VVASAYDVLAKGAALLNQNLRRFDTETQGLLSGKIRLASVSEGEISTAVMSKGLLDRNVCPGQELITEKLFIYQESPKEVVKFLENYFKNTNTTSVPPTPAEAVAKAPQAAASEAVEKKPALPLVAKEPMVDRCALEPASAFKVIEDPTGIIVTGTAQQIELAVRLTDDVDIATKQVLAEVFLVEVQKNWERTIQTKFGAGNTTRAFSVGAVGNVLDAATLATSKGINGAQGKFSARSPDIEGFINLLETNAVGRNISSPTLIAKNGEEAEINKVITLRKTVQTVITAAQTGAVTQPALPNQQVQKLDVPLKLKIKPNINQHNKHVTLRFEYEETSLNSDPADSPIEKGTTKNSISTTLETAPGEVVVLAGLFKEANSQTTNSLPGVSGLGVLAPVFGGANALSTLSTELLVFIKPTVIEPKSQISQAKGGY
jgi:type II secretory pathway component GspD/PulD (secretin)